MVAVIVPLTVPVRAQVSVDMIVSRHIGAARDRATNHPRSEGDQAVVNGWPLYRTDRGQAVFNTAMATLAATDRAAPPTATGFDKCAGLMCALDLPAIDKDGWVQAGRLWTSAAAYVLIVRSPRQRDFRRRSLMNMRYFVMHEFHNSSRNTDLFDTISSHSSSVFVPLYLSKTMQDAQGRSFVILAQVAPIDVVSVHASNMGSEGPGIEIAKNTGDTLEPLQGTAAMLAAMMAKAFTPRLTVVNHRGDEGRAALRTYEMHARAASGTRFKPPFTPVASQHIAAVTGRLETVLAPRNGSAPITVAQRTVVPRKTIAPASSETDAPYVEIPPLAMAAVPAARSTASFLGHKGDPAGTAERTEPRLIAPPRLAARPSKSWPWTWPWLKPGALN